MIAQIEFGKSVLFRKRELYPNHNYIFFKRDADTRTRKRDHLPTTDSSSLLTVDICAPRFIGHHTVVPPTTLESQLSLLLICHQYDINDQSLGRMASTQIFKASDHMYLNGEMNRMTRNVPFNVQLARGKIKLREFVFVLLDHDKKQVYRVQWKEMEEQEFTDSFFKILSRNTKDSGVQKQIQNGITLMNDDLWQRIERVALESIHCNPTATEHHSKRKRLEYDQITCGMENEETELLSNSAKRMRYSAVMEVATSPQPSFLMTPAQQQQQQPLFYGHQFMTSSSPSPPPPPQQPYCINETALLQMYQIMMMQQQQQSMHMPPQETTMPYYQTDPLDLGNHSIIATTNMDPAYPQDVKSKMDPLEFSWNVIDDIYGNLPFLNDSEHVKMTTTPSPTNNEIVNHSSVLDCDHNAAAAYCYARPSSAENTMKDSLSHGFACNHANFMDGTVRVSAMRPSIESEVNQMTPIELTEDVNDLNWIPSLLFD